MMQKSTTDDRYTVVGVVSAGIKCGSEYPGLYTRVDKYLEWINEVITP